MDYSARKIFYILNQNRKNQLCGYFPWILHKNADDTVSDGGYHDTNFSFMIHLYNGWYYSRASCSQYIQTNLIQPAINNQIFSASIDTINKTIKFYLNGKLLAPAKKIELTLEEVETIYPCVDLYSQGDRVSFVC